jgi:hypothetical protein
MSENLKVWDSMSKPPATALKQIGGGRLKGKSDINPQWRYKAMTENFGLCGIGWKYTIDRQWIEDGVDGVVMAFVNVSLYIKIENEWSEPIPANGGSELIKKEKEGMYSNDEAFKMAETDALGTAMKKLGVASEIYEGNWDGSKYITGEKQDNIKMILERKVEALEKSPNMDSALRGLEMVKGYLELEKRVQKVIDNING